ncbi:MAG TPA: carboxypeptidase-like regulatory domain-containing protein, partial [Sphingobacterium sp.]|nr:carboxypeptidase-like regulatory domain-containing protein [Sphingobacterium sp.]
MTKLLYSIAISIYILCGYSHTFAQQITGTILNHKDEPIEQATILIKGSDKSTSSDNNGKFVLDHTASKVTLQVSAIGYQPLTRTLESEHFSNGTYILKIDNQNLDEVVVSGTLKAVSKLDSPIPVEVYSASFFRANPTPTIFESLQNINGVRPQINCSVCNTGDIHINGLEGPYTMVLIDGMP